MGSRMEELERMIREADDAYYNGGRPVMDDHEYDLLREEMEGISGEPVEKVGAAPSGKLAMDRHEYPALSLAKTKDPDEFVGAFREHDKEGLGVVLMWKLDGSTLNLTYDGGRLEKAVTRGDGETGQVIVTAGHIAGIPEEIPYKGRLVVRGEAVMSYGEFERINAGISGEEKYKNPRNLANATITMLDPDITIDRHIEFKAFNLVHMDGMEGRTFYYRMAALMSQGFGVVPLAQYGVDELKEAMEEWGREAEEYEFPVDGLVAALNDAASADALPGTGHHPHIMRGYAFKWKDEEAETVLRGIEWSASRTGLLNPVAVFDPVELEGTTVARASLHNVSYILEKDLKTGDRITVYKANKIIPQVSENMDGAKGWDGESVTDEDHARLPLVQQCPACGGEVNYRRRGRGSDGKLVVTAECISPDCPAKNVGRFVHFAERGCMELEGFSEKTIEKFVYAGIIREYADFFKLDRFRDRIVGMEGFGEKSYENLAAAAEKARKTSFVPFVHALGIPNVGKGQAKLLSPFFGGDALKFLESRGVDFTQIDGIGEVLNRNINDWLRYYAAPFGAKEFHNASFDHAQAEVWNLVQELDFEIDEEKTEGTSLAGKTFVITGKVSRFANRKEAQAFIEANGGKAAGSVSKSTSYLVNNDVTSGSGKNKKAKELGIPIISEDELIAMAEN